MSEEEIIAMTPEQLAKEMMRCKLDVWSNIREIQGNMIEGSSRMDVIEASLSSIKDSLSKSEVQRTDYNNAVKIDMKELKDWFFQHNQNEMEKYDDIILAIQTLTSTVTHTKEDTDMNTKLLAIKARKEEVDAEVAKILGARGQDMHDIKIAAIKAVVVMGAMGIAGIVWSVVKAYS